MSRADLHELALRYRPEFPIFETAIYLNTCSLGALSRRARGALDEFADLWSMMGASAWYDHWLHAATEARRAFARLVRADPEEVALAPSVSGGLSAIASALDYGTRPKVVTTELDFPTLVYQFRARRREGVETVVLPSPNGITVPVESFVEAVDDRTALVATSHVYFATGAIQDVPAIADLAHRHGALCLIDAYQSTGQIPVRARELGVDVLLSGTLKWLLGGPGLAFLYVRRELIEDLEPAIASWFSVRDQFAFDPRRLDLHGDARRFQLGTPSVPTIYTALAGLNLIEEIGEDRIRRRVSALTEALIERAAELGMRVRGPDRAEERSGIVMIEHADPAAAVRGMRAEGIIVDWRPGGVRLSPHFYNTTEDGDRAMEVLSAG